MDNNDARSVAETVFQGQQSREKEVSKAFKLEEERQAAVIKNMHRLRALRLSRKQSKCATREG